MRKIFLISYFAFIYAHISNAQQTPCSATVITPSTDGACTMSSTQTAPATTNTWTTNLNTGTTTSPATGISNNCQSQPLLGAGNLWFRYTVPTTGDLDMMIGFTNAGGGNVNAVEFEVYQLTSGSCAGTLGLTYVGCGNSSAGAASGTYPATPGATYFVRMYDDNADKDMSGEKYKYCFGFVARNDNCVNATTVVPGTPIVESTLGSSLDAPFTGGGWCPTGNVWYTFTTGANPGCFSYYMTQSSAGCNYVSVYQGGCPSTGGTLLNNNVSTNIYNDQGSNEPGFGGMLPNTTYYVSVANDIAGPFTFNIQGGTTAASNDNCTNPLSIGTSATSTDNAVAGCEYSYLTAQDANITPASICAGSLENVSWFSFTTQSSPATSNVTISFSNILCNNGGGGFQTGLFTGVCPTLTATGSCVAAASGTVNYTINNSPAGTVYYIAMDGNAGSNCHFSVSGINIVPLPIELLSFNAEAFSSGYVQLNWKTISETNNDYFSIERSADGLNFELMGIMDGAGNSNQILDYSTRDLNPLSGTGYYRLKQTDYDGNSTYSSISKVEFNEADELYFNIYPNPTSEGSNPILSLTGNEEEEMIVNIYEMTGKLISSTKVILNSNGVTNVEMKTNLSQGIYLISATNSKNITQVKKFVVE